MNEAKTMRCQNKRRRNLHFAQHLNHADCMGSGTAVTVGTNVTDT